MGKDEKLQLRFPAGFTSDNVQCMTEQLKSEIEKIAQNARKASRMLGSATTKQKNFALERIAQELESNRKTLSEENEKDLQGAKENNLSDAMIDRLRLNHERIDAMAQGLRQLIDLPDPVGGLIEEKTRPNGLTIHKGTHTINKPKKDRNFT